MARIDWKVTVLFQIFPGRVNYTFIIEYKYNSFSVKTDDEVF